MTNDYGYTYFPAADPIKVQRLRVQLKALQEKVDDSLHCKLHYPSLGKLLE
jgi:hypothetical protein